MGGLLCIPACLQRLHETFAGFWPLCQDGAAAARRSFLLFVGISSALFFGG